jgi:hypothetical protein
MSFLPLERKEKKIAETIKEMERSRWGGREGLQLVEACEEEKWEEAKAIIAKNPRLVCTARNANGFTPVYYAVLFNNVEILDHMLAAILLSLHYLRQQKRPLVEEEEKRQQQQMLRDAFERGNNYGWTPAHAAITRDHVECLAFLVEHAPSGFAAMEEKGKDGWTPACWAAYFGRVEALDLLVRNVPRVLETKDMYGFSLKILPNGKTVAQARKMVTDRIMTLPSRSQEDTCMHALSLCP